MALGPHGGLELLKSFHSDIQDGHHVSHLENLQTTSPPATAAILKIFIYQLMPWSIPRQQLFTFWIFPSESYP